MADHLGGGVEDALASRGVWFHAQLLQEVAAGADDAVEGRPRDSGRGGDLVHGGRAWVAFEQAAGAVENPRSGAHATTLDDTSRLVKARRANRCDPLANR